MEIRNAQTDRDLEQLVGLFNLKKKREVERYCRSLVLTPRAFTDIILCARTGGLDHYKYACRFRHTMPAHLNPSSDEIQAAGRDLKVGPLQGAAKKFTRKVFQGFEDRRLFAAHLFYTPCHTWWHVFYFDQRDRDEYRNHWRNGAHIHYANDLFTHLALDEVWDRVSSGDINFLNGAHLRYDDSSRRVQRRVL
jgi:hypothetical protein